MRIRPAPPITGPESKGLGTTNFKGGPLPHTLHSIAPLVEQSCGDVAASSLTSKDAPKSLGSRQRTAGGVGLVSRAPARATPSGTAEGSQWTQLWCEREPHAWAPTRQSPRGRPSRALQRGAPESPPQCVWKAEPPRGGPEARTPSPRLFLNLEV